MTKAAFVAALLSTSFAASAGWTGFVGYADGAHNGGEVALGYRYEAASGTAIALHPLQGVIYSTGAPEGYREETFSNGQTVCRDLSNGQFAKKSNCEDGLGFEYTPSAELTQRLGTKISIGAGYRGGDKASVYGVLQVYAFKVVHIGIRGGPEYTGAFVGAHF